MNYLVIGSGGREHAIAWKLSMGQKTGKVYITPGNGGTSECADTVALDINDAQSVIDFCHQANIDLVVIGPEAPLVAGLADKLWAAEIKAIGPDAYGAQLEGSKDFTKSLCQKWNIPTARYQSFERLEDAISHLNSLPLPVVVKADGLAAGKGVIIANTIDEAKSAATELMAGGHTKLVIEEFLEGEEASAFYLCDGITAKLLGTAQDHKRAFDGDTGPNTGGMGAYSPAPQLTDQTLQCVEDQIITPTLKAMAAEGHPYKGILYAGLMLTEEGPKLIEYNCRFGDPECQVILLRLHNDLGVLMNAAATGTLQDQEIKLDHRHSLTVVLAAQGYPGPYDKGSLIQGLEEAATAKEVKIFHAGTKDTEKGLVANGGRVLNVCALADTLWSAQQIAYDSCSKIEWPEGFYRTDIAHRAL